MGRSQRKISIVVLSLLFIASTTSATELLQNGGFESGQLDPWVTEGAFSTWTVSSEYAYEGTYSGFVRGTDRLAQSFVPRMGSEIEVFSIAVMTAMPAWVTVEIQYIDGLDATRASVYVPVAFDWRVFDLVDSIAPDREVCRVVLSGHQNGDSPDHLRTWYDAVTMQNNAPDDPPRVLADEVIQAEVKKIKMRFNLKKQRTHVNLALEAEQLPIEIEDGSEVQIRVLLTHDGFTTAFEGSADLVDVPHKNKNIIRLMDASSAEKFD